jgi:hypothetical protein
MGDLLEFSNISFEYTHQGLQMKKDFGILPVKSGILP